MVVKGLKRKQYKIDITLGGQALEQVSEFRYLGFCLNERHLLTVSAGIIAQSCQKRFGMYRQQITNLISGYPLSLAQTLFEAIVRSALNFGAEMTGGRPGCDSLQIKMFTHYYGLRSSTNHDAVYWLSGPYSSSFRQTRMQLNFVKTVLNRPRGSLLREAFENVLIIERLRKRTWLENLVRSLGSTLTTKRRGSPAAVTDLLKNLNIGRVMDHLESEFDLSLATCEG